MNKKLLIILAVLTLLIAVPVTSMIIEHHIRINKDALQIAPDNEITRIIKENEDYHHLGNIITDISVVYYFSVDTEDKNFFETLINIFTFNIGSEYRATHSQEVCRVAIEKAKGNEKLLAVAYGICTHQIQDSISHNKVVTQSIQQAKLSNGLVHSPEEIHFKNLFATEEDRAYSRQILDLAYEDDIQDYLENVFVNDPALSQVNIRNMIDFFVKQVQPNAEYQLGFKSFFALPSYIYWFILVMAIFSLTMVALSIRRLRSGMKNTQTIFLLGAGTVLVGFFGLVIYGLFAGNLWKIWESLSQFIFSPAMYVVGITTALIAIGIVVDVFKSKHKSLDQLGSIYVALFLAILTIISFNMAGALEVGNEQALHDLAVENTVDFYQNGVNYIYTIEAPDGFDSLAEAEAETTIPRNITIWLLVVLLGLIIYDVFRRKK